MEKIIDKIIQCVEKERKNLIDLWKTVKKTGSADILIVLLLKKFKKVL